MSGTKFTFTPEPYERAYYEGLFHTADTQRAGNIGGAQAVPFFARSKLPIETLKNVWTLSDQPATNTLDLTKFTVAVRLIQLLQNGTKGNGTNLAAPPGVTLRPAMFEGVSGVSVNMPQPQQQQQGGGPTPQQQGQQQQAPPQQQQQMQGQGQQQPPSPQRQQMQQQQMQQPSSPPNQMQQQQRQMQPPSPPSPQRQQQHPAQQGQGMTPPRPQMAGAQGHANANASVQAYGSTALAVQDPYTLSPSEQSRYEGIFAEYAKEDGYVYGQEAVALFSKSGLPQPLLAAIWNMVDIPVDNRLDKLEFAMGMHLIVCISRKQLPMPGSLPASLVHLKSQQSAAAGARSPSMQSQGQPTPHSPSRSVSSQPMQQQQQPPPMQLGGASTFSDMSIPTMQHSQQQQHQAPPIQPSPSMTPSMTGSLSGGMGGGAGQAPPLQPVGGGLDISDAFAGLSTTGETGPSYMNSAPPPVPTSVTFESNSPVREYEQAPVAAPQPASPVQQQQPAMTMRASSPALAPAEPPKTTSQLASSYDMGGAHEEMDKLKSILQRLQAENISLKAQLGNMTEDEKDVQKELGATVAEIGKLSSELTGMRAQVLAAKSRLLEATSDLKGAKEKKGVVTGLIVEAKGTKSAIEDAHAAVESSLEMSRAAPHAPAPVNSFDGDLFGFDEPAPAPAPEPLRAPAQSYSSAYSEDEEEEVQLPMGVPSSQSEQPMGISSMQSNNSEDYGHRPSEDYGMAPLPGPPPGGPYEFSPPANSPSHLRTTSSASAGAFDSEAIMGGAPTPLPTEAAEPPSYGGASEASSYYGHDKGGPTPTNENIAELKRKAKEAEDLASDAEESRRQVMAQVNELRRVSDEAEALSRQNATSPKDEKKKKGFLGRGKNKKDIKEKEHMAQDAKKKKEQFLAAQANANDTQAIAMQTKQEAEKLRSEAEEAEMLAAAAASMQHSHSTNGHPSQAKPAPSYNSQSPSPSYNSQPPAHSYAQPPAQSYNSQPSVQSYNSQPSAQSYNSQPPVLSIGGGNFEGQPYGGMNGAYNPAVMGGGGGGNSIPTPSNDPYNSIPSISGDGDPYDNPF